MTLNCLAKFGIKFTSAALKTEDPKKEDNELEKELVQQGHNAVRKVAEAFWCESLARLRWGRRVTCRNAAWFSKRVLPTGCPQVKSIMTITILTMKTKGAAGGRR